MAFLQEICKQEEKEALDTSITTLMTAKIDFISMSVVYHMIGLYGNTWSWTNHNNYCAINLIVLLPFELDSAGQDCIFYLTLYVKMLNASSE
jgi:hypothetical protein